LIGRPPRSSIFKGELLSWILYSKPPIFWVPTLLAAEWIRDRRARHRHQRRAQLVDADVGEVLFGEAIAGQCDLDDRNGGGAVVEDQRRCRTRRHLLDQRLRDRRDLGIGGADIDVRLKENLDDAEAVIGVRDDVFDIVDRCRQRPLKRRGDAPSHLIRRKARVLPDHADHGNTNVRKNVGRRAQRGEWPDNQEEQREHDESIRPAERDANQCDHKTGIPRSGKRAWSLRPRIPIRWR
jgi:hypothetical protein